MTTIANWISILAHDLAGDFALLFGRAIQTDEDEELGIH